MSEHEPFTERDRIAVHHQLGREPRATRAVAHRCSCGLPDVVQTNPRTEDGTPFPTMYYLTCPRAASVISSAARSPADIFDVSISPFVFVLFVFIVCFFVYFLFWVFFVK